ncbi:MAG: TetR family transcriptional regulator [Dehalococcoidia bacterium]|nr:TetR family transcriptional regulator [Dehalococcoidia bacterium]
MARKGWNETSIDEITREAGVSRGLVSYHFKDKADLLSGVLARCEEASSTSIARSVEVASEPAEQLRSAVRTALQLTRDDPAIYEIFLHFVASGRADPYLAEQIRNLYRGFRKVTAAAIRNGQATGAFRYDVDPDAAAARHIGSLTGFAIQWLLDPGSFDFEAAAGQTEEMLVSYLTAGPRRRPETSAEEAVPA